MFNEGTPRCGGPVGFLPTGMSWSHSSKFRRTWDMSSVGRQLRFELPVIVSNELKPLLSAYLCQLSSPDWPMESGSSCPF